MIYVGNSTILTPKLPNDDDNISWEPICKTATKTEFFDNPNFVSIVNTEDILIEPTSLNDIGSHMMGIQ